MTEAMADQVILLGGRGGDGGEAAGAGPVSMPRTRGGWVRLTGTSGET